ncbi:hypothetical protein KCP70_10400 [Salmonella enterica subsp. enterica]|nr:hypothetical protein KCP70_10400 [Salmonella enterica subsp. enterica]
MVMLGGVDLKFPTGSILSQSAVTATCALADASFRAAAYPLPIRQALIAPFSPVYKRAGKHRSATGAGVHRVAGILQQSPLTPAEMKTPRPLACRWPRSAAAD